MNKVSQMLYREKKGIREKGKDLTQSYDKSLYTHRKNPKTNVTTQKRHQNLWLHNDCGLT